MRVGYVVAAAAGAAAVALWATRRRRADAAPAANVRHPEAPPLAQAAPVSAATATGAATQPPPRSPRPLPHPRRPTTGLPRTFDALFARHARGIPVAYLRALADAESGLNPDDRLGLINVVPTALADYNRRHGTQIRASQMTDPDVNVEVAVDTLRAIIASYSRNHPDVPTLREDWNDPDFVALVTFGWNAGFSELGGVGRVVSYLRRTAPGAPITLDTVADAATAAGAVAHLANPRKRAYSRGVVAAYLRERAADARA